MNSALAALGISTLLVLAGVAIPGVAPRADAPDASEQTAPAGAHDARASPGGHGGGAYAWTGGTGQVPDLTAALLQLERRSSIVIRNDSQFTPAAGVRSGSGTFEDPFVISGWFVDTVIIADTSKAFELKENYVANILVLDWTGQGGYVHHNYVENLRTNRNVARTGDASAAVIEQNTILRVEELRHFDGEVRNNTIGREGALGLLANKVAFNIAGLNGAGIYDNVIFGGVDMKIHGHHHSNTPGAQSHNHGEADEAQGEDDVEDHQVRYVDFNFYRNRIVDDGFGLRYNDLNHAGDDRKATSEQEPDLELPHVHHTRISIRDNVIDGATLRFATVNAPDERHLAGQSAEVLVYNNSILKPAAGDGIVLAGVRDATVRIHNNTVEKGQLQLSGTSAILLQAFENSTVVVGQNALGAYKYGVRAANFDAATRWVVEDNDAPGVDYPVYWDDSVANPPDNMGAADGQGRADEHGGAPDAEAPAPTAAALPFDVRNTRLK